MDQGWQIAIIVMIPILGVLIIVAVILGCSVYRRWRKLRMARDQQLGSSADNRQPEPTFQNRWLCSGRSSRHSGRGNQGRRDSTGRRRRSSGSWRRRLSAMCRINSCLPPPYHEVVKGSPMVSYPVEEDLPPSYDQYVTSCDVMALSHVTSPNVTNLSSVTSCGVTNPSHVTSCIVTDRQARNCGNLNNSSTFESERIDNVSVVFTTETSRQNVFGYTTVVTIRND